MTIRSILLLLEIFYCHLVYLVAISYIFPNFGILYQEKSDNPVLRYENYPCSYFFGNHFNIFLNALLYIHIWNENLQTFLPEHIYLFVYKKMGQS
jgi:hypothetical protein